MLKSGFGVGERKVFGEAHRHHNQCAFIMDLNVKVCIFFEILGTLMLQEEMGCIGMMPFNKRLS